MRYLLLILTFIIFFLPRLVNAEWRSSLKVQQDELIGGTISSPVAGQAVQGSVVIRGSTTVDGFQSYEVDFAYSEDPTQTWFLIQESTSLVQDGVLAVWDTTTITDGDYTLRLVVNLVNGAQVEVSIPGLRMRNYSPIETETPSLTLPYVTLAAGTPIVQATLLATLLPTVSPLPLTATALPTNPAEISSSQVMLTFGKGAAFTIGLFALLGAYLGMRAILHNRK
jgi:hypothetical protein